MVVRLCSHLLGMVVVVVVDIRKTFLVLFLVDITFYMFIFEVLVDDFFNEKHIRFYSKCFHFVC